MYNFSNSLYKIENEDMVILVNLESGQWMRISKKVNDIVEYLVNQGYEFKDNIIKFSDINDLKFIEKILKDMISIGILENNHRQYIENKVLLIEVTRKCNLKCTHCCVEADMQNTELSTFQIVDLLNKAFTWKPDKICITGGEPLIRSDIDYILGYLRKNFKGKISLLTNGTLINSQNIDLIIKNVDTIEMSVDGIDEETSSKIRGEGVFTTVINNVKFLKERGFHDITLSTILGDKNYNWSDAFLELNEKLGTKPILRQFVPVGRGRTVRNNFLNNTGGANIDKIFSEENLKKKYTKKLTACSCKAGKAVLYIDYKGDLYLCQFLLEDEFKVGNVLKLDNFYDLSELIESLIKKLKNYYPQNYEKCKKCKVNVFCWPCPGELYRAKYEQTYFEGTCKKIKPVLTKKIWG